MGVGQISMMTEKLYQGNERNLVKIFGSVNEEQLEAAIDKMSVRQSKQHGTTITYQHLMAPSSLKA